MKLKSELADKKITVLGAARSGIAVAKLLHKAGAHVFVSDSAQAEKKESEVGELKKAGIKYEFGQHSSKVYEVELVVLSPGIPVRSELVQSFIKKNIPVLSEIEVAYWFCESPIIAVTGSNGKTTTTTLIGEMLKKKYPQAIVAGNIGTAFSEYVEDSKRDSWSVIEVSSFQLETIDMFHPKQAVVLNFAPNHLNRYENYENYLKAKWRITKNLIKDDILIYNAADSKLSEWAEQIDCNLQGFHIEGVESHAAYYFNDTIFINDKRLAGKEEIKIKGKHNYMNVMAASLAAINAGVSREQICEVLKSFEGIEHRLEFVAIKNGISYVNDSKATTVESLGYALQSFNEPIVLITGGQDKGSDFTELNELICENVKAIVLIGTSAEIMINAWRGLVPIYKEESLKDAVNTATKLAEEKNTVLLSPACASFDMFKDYEDRGRQFKQIVHEIQVH
jgi:UDP-N-acetylmuramoylalanine--D-glutamate ligase